MIKIGDFSKLAHVSIKTLHHYDDLGLLKPRHIDRYSGYRYYEIEQLSQLNRILALKDLGFSLEQVAQLLHEQVSTAEMRGMLRLKQMELAVQVNEEQARLLRVEQRLRQLEVDGCPPQSEIAIKDIPAQTVLLAQVVAASEDAIAPARQSLHTLLLNYLESARLKPASPWFALLDDMPYQETDLELTLAVGVDPRSGQRAGDWEGTPVRLQELAAVPGMASVIHQDDYAILPQTYKWLYAWTQSNGYQVAGPCREIYLPGSGVNAPQDSPLTTGLIEVQCPIEKPSIPVSLSSNQKEETMQPKIVNRPAFKAVGLSYVGKNENGEIGQMWGRFNQIADQIKRINDQEAFGLCFSTVQGPSQPGEFEYVASFEVADDKGIPEGMVCREVPAHKYAVFTHHGKLNTLGETYSYIYNTGLAQAGLEVHPDKFDMEVYDKDFLFGSDDSKFYIYVAVN
ncbi:MAG: MerR family transcriptional regulator [Anaerolineales bacterium]|nr:MerR family transcriptional regulator [Anaerolineales bacterium]